MVRYILICVLAFASFISCKNEKPNNNLSDLDLMSYGLPIKIKAPADAAVVSDDLGIVQDVTVKGEENYFLQIIAGQAYVTDVKSLLDKQKGEVTGMKYFSKIIEEDEAGFIFEKRFSEDRTNFDFRKIIIQGDKEYIFQAGLMGQFSLDDIKVMYSAI